MDLESDLKELLESLISNRVAFVVIGSHALACYAEPRSSKGFHVFIGATDDNLRKLSNAIRTLGFSLKEVDLDELLQPRKKLALGVPPNQFFILNHLTGLTFEEVWEMRLEVDVGRLQVPIISRDHMIINKLALKRPIDRWELSLLEAHGVWQKT